MTMVSRAFLCRSNPVKFASVIQTSANLIILLKFLRARLSGGNRWMKRFAVRLFR